MGTLSPKGTAEAARTVSATDANGATRVLPRIMWLGVLCAALILSRWMLFPRRLLTFDSINFALAVDQFNPALHQPQPPGYPLFVGLLKVLSMLTPNIETTFLTAALLVSSAALIFLWWLCESIIDSIIGRGWGVIGPLLLLFNPAFWLSSLLNPARLCLAAGASAVALCAWQACRRNSPRWFIAAAAVLGVAAGFQPTLAVVLAPLLLWSAWQMRASWTVVGLALLCFGAAVCTWLPSLIAAAGGAPQFARLLRSYSGNEFAGSSLLFGAAFYNALRMAWRALVWSCLGIVSWIWAVPLATRKVARIADTFTSHFLAAWFIPGLLFYATFHVGDPDHTLSIIPAACVTGALTLAAFTRNTIQVKRIAPISTAIVLNIFLFFVPIGRTARASSYYAVQSLRDYIIPMLDALRSLPGPVTAVFYEPVVGWRQLSYYEPRMHIVVVLETHDGRVTARHISGRQVTLRTEPDGTVALPSCGSLAWIDPQARPRASDGVMFGVVGSLVFYTPAQSNESFDFRDFNFISGRETCGGDVTTRHLPNRR